MLKIIKAEFNYHKLIFILPFGIVLAAMVANVILKWPQHEYDLQAVKKLMLLAVVLPFLFYFICLIKEKRDRYNALLPIPKWKIRLSNVLFVIITWACLLFLYWLATSIARPYSIDIIIWDTLSVTGFVLLANAISFIYRDVAYISFSKFQQSLLVISFLIFAILALIYYLQLGVGESSYKIFAPLLPIKENVIRVSAYGPAAMVILLFGLGMTILSFATHRRRGTFVE